MNDFQSPWYNKTLQYKYFFLLLLFVLIAYLPLSGFQFALKNDAYTDNFPNKYFFSEALQNRIFPLWNPYLNYGFPVYADPGFAYYHPVTWLFGLIGYTPYTFTIEVIFHLFLGACGMYVLAKRLLQNKAVAFLCGAMYVCSGFFVGNLQHINFITGAAMLPFVVHYFLKLLYFPSLKNSLKLSLSGYLLLAGGHPAIPVGTLYCLIFLFIISVILRLVNRNQLLRFFQYALLSVVILVLSFIPAIYAYAHVLPFYGMANTNLTFNPGAHTTFGSLFSLLFPLATNSGNVWWGNDISMRNWFYSVPGFLFTAIAVVSLRNRQATAFSLVAAIMFLFSIDGDVRSVLFHNLPLLGYIRTNGEFRVFSILFLILTAGYGINFFYQNQQKFLQVKRLLPAFILAAAAFAGYLIISGQINIFSEMQTPSIRGIKTLLATVSFTDLLLINLFFVCLTLTALFFALPKFSRLKWVILPELVISCWLCLPFTGVGQTSVKAIQNVLHTMPKNFPAPPLQPVHSNDTFPEHLKSLIGDASYYNKQIGVKRLTDYPSYFSSTETALKRDTSFLNKPFLFFDKPDVQYRIVKFKPQEIVVDYAASSESNMVLLQNHYKFWNAEVNGGKLRIENAFGSFMQTKAPAGKYQIRIFYSDKIFQILLACSAMLLLITTIAIFRKKTD